MKGAGHAVYLVMLVHYSLESALIGELAQAGGIVGAKEAVKVKGFSFDNLSVRGRKGGRWNAGFRCSTVAGTGDGLES